MAHARQQIREAAAGIVTGLTTTGSNVYQSRAYALGTSELPCLLVYTNTEEVVGPQTIGSPRRIERDLELVIQGIHRNETGLDDRLDTIASEVETAIAADPTLGLNVVDTLLARTDIEYDVETDKPIGSVILRFIVRYITAETAPDTLL